MGECGGSTGECTNISFLRFPPLLIVGNRIKKHSFFLSFSLSFSLSLSLSRSLAAIPSRYVLNRAKKPTGGEGGKEAERRSVEENESRKRNFPPSDGR